MYLRELARPTAGTSYYQFLKCSLFCFVFLETHVTPPLWCRPNGTCWHYIQYSPLNRALPAMESVPSCPPTLLLPPHSGGAELELMLLLKAHFIFIAPPDLSCGSVLPVKGDWAECSHVCGSSPVLWWFEIPWDRSLRLSCEAPTLFVVLIDGRTRLWPGST